jgi:hypothetical protein
MEDQEKLQSYIVKHKEAGLIIKEVASEIKMISINAAIEAAHAASGIKALMEKVLDVQMTTNCRMLARIIEAGGLLMDSSEIIKFAGWIGVDDIFVTDGDGVTIGSNYPEAYGWRFPDDPKAQAYVFRSLIETKDGVVTQSIQARDLDNAMYKFVGVSRIDEPGIVQIGYRAETISQYQAEVGTVFGVLADAISALGIKVTTSAREMKEITQELESILKEKSG